MLSIIYEGINRVKENIINHLLQKYEFFKMNSDESISEIYHRFSDIIVSLRNLDQHIEMEK